MSVKCAVLAEKTYTRLVYELLVLLKAGQQRGLLPLRVVLNEVGHDVDGDGEDDGAVVLGRDAVEGLQVAQLPTENIK